MHNVIKRCFVKLFIAKNANILGNEQILLFETVTGFNERNYAYLVAL